MHHQRKGQPNCFEQASYNFPHKKRRAEEAKSKGAAVSHQCNQDLTVPNKHMCFSVAFFEFIIKEREDGIALKKAPTIFPTRKGGLKKRSLRVLQFLIKETTI